MQKYDFTVNQKQYIKMAYKKGPHELNEEVSTKSHQIKKEEKN